MLYDHEYDSFYALYGDPFVFRGENIQEEELQLMKSYYPETARLIQERVEQECEKMDYEGSRMYDEYPDRFMLYHLCRKIRRSIERDVQMQDISPGFLDELIQVLLFQEISRRRYRRRRCGRYF